MSMLVATHGTGFRITIHVGDPTIREERHPAASLAEVALAMAHYFGGLTAAANRRHMTARDIACPLCCAIRRTLRKRRTRRTTKTARPTTQPTAQIRNRKGRANAESTREDGR